MMGLTILLLEILLILTVYIYSYILFGSNQTVYVNMTENSRVIGEQKFPNSTDFSVSSAGDVNRDGISDMI
jgi:hypothetical protein